MPTPPILTAICAHCGEQFTFERLGKRLRKYCSPQCLHKAAKARAATARSDRAIARITHCELCGTAIEVRNVRERPGRFCSPRCRHRSYNASPAGKARDRRRKANRVAPGSASRSLRQRTFDRDGWRCQCCGQVVQTEHNDTADSAVIRMLDSAASRPRQLEHAVTLCRRCCGRLKLTSEIIAAAASRQREGDANAAGRLGSRAGEISQTQACEGA